MSDFHEVFHADYVRKTHEALDLATRLAKAEQGRDAANRAVEREREVYGRALKTERDKALDLALRLEAMEQERDEARENWQSQISWASELEVENQQLLAEGWLLREALGWVTSETRDLEMSGKHRIWHTTWGPYRSHSSEQIDDCPICRALAGYTAPLVAAEVERVRKLEALAVTAKALLREWTEDRFDGWTENRREVLDFTRKQPPTGGELFDQLDELLAALDAKEAPDAES